MAYHVYLNKILLPITPQKITTKISGGNETVNLINGGEINIIKDNKLSDISMECLLPQVQFPFANYLKGFKSAEYFLIQFEKLKTSKKPFSLKILRYTPDDKPLFEHSSNIEVTLESYEITEDAESGLDIMVKLDFKQYRNYGTKKLTPKTNNKANGNKTMIHIKEVRPTKKDGKSTYKIEGGFETLPMIAKKATGDASKWKELYEKNKKLLDAERKVSTLSPLFAFRAGLEIKLK